MNFSTLPLPVWLIRLSGLSDCLSGLRYCLPDLSDCLFGFLDYLSAIENCLFVLLNCKSGISDCLFPTVSIRLQLFVSVYWCYFSLYLCVPFSPLPGQLLEKIWYLLIWANCGDLFFVLLADLQKIEQRGPERERRNFHQFPFLNHNSVDGLFLELKVNTENFTNTIGQIV